MWSIGVIFEELICGRSIPRTQRHWAIYYIMHKCGSITEQAWQGISYIISRDFIQAKWTQSPKRTADVWMKASYVSLSVYSKLFKLWCLSPNISKTSTDWRGRLSLLGVDIICKGYQMSVKYLIANSWIFGYSWVRLQRLKYVLYNPDLRRKYAMKEVMWMNSNEFVKIADQCWRQYCKRTKNAHTHNRETKTWTDTRTTKSLWNVSWNNYNDRME